VPDFCGLREIAYGCARAGAGAGTSPASAVRVGVDVGVVVSRIFASWNQRTHWLRELDALRLVA